MQHLSDSSCTSAKKRSAETITQVPCASIRFHKRKANLAKLQDGLAKTVLTRAMIEAPAQTGAELALKASVLLDWLAQQAGTFPECSAPPCVATFCGCSPRAKLARRDLTQLQGGVGTNQVGR